MLSGIIIFCEKPFSYCLRSVSNNACYVSNCFRYVINSERYVYNCFRYVINSGRYVSICLRYVNNSNRYVPYWRSYVCFESKAFVDNLSWFYLNWRTSYDRYVSYWRRYVCFDNKGLWISLLTFISEPNLGWRIVWDDAYKYNLNLPTFYQNISL